MQEELYEELRSIEEVHWWLTARRRLLLHFLRRICRRFAGPPRVLDCGCGTGLLARQLSEFARTVGVDDWPHRQPVADARGRCAFLRARIEELPFGDGAFDVVCAFDVLEHLDDDRAALVRMRRLLGPRRLGRARVSWKQHGRGYVRCRTGSRSTLSSTSKGLWSEPVRRPVLTPCTTTPSPTRQWSMGI